MRNKAFHKNRFEKLILFKKAFGYKNNKRIQYKTYANYINIRIISSVYRYVGYVILKIYSTCNINYRLIELWSICGIIILIWNLERKRERERERGGGDGEQSTIT